MANVLVQDTSLTAIANAIREKNGSTDTYKPAEMATAIQGIQAGGGELKYIQMVKSFPMPKNKSGTQTITNTNLPTDYTFVMVMNGAITRYNVSTGIVERIQTGGDINGVSYYIGYDKTTQTISIGWSNASTVSVSSREYYIYAFWVE